MRFNITKIAILSMIDDTNNPEYKVYTFVEKLEKGKQMFDLVGKKNDELYKHIGKPIELKIDVTTKNEVFELNNGEKKYAETVNYFLVDAKPYKKGAVNGENTTE